jgi:type I restriction-modification system DNA methylase subunit/predicted type IV restriction endonuclease
MTVPKEIKTLVERFKQNREAYRSSAYNETQLRQEFIDPFFEALGWDVDNEQGYAEAYKDVIHEDAIKVGGATKAPDYAFRIGGTRKFFVEAKRPGVNVKEDVEAAYQLRRYAWSAGLDLSILTNFEEFAVYERNKQPNKDDKASKSRALYFTYDQYEEEWDKIAGIFSPESIRKGSFERYAKSKTGRRGTAEVGDAFLKEIEGWRDVLARNIALRNPKLSTHELNFAVQRTIDRIIFLRICEDRGIEAYSQLMALRNGTNTYKRLAGIFRHADERYNSGLFHFRKEKDRGGSPDELTLGLKIDDTVLKAIFKDLYYPDSPYEFSVLPADILGHIYEQFLGKVIRLTPAHRAVVEEKPEVRKAGGVYYTPTYIVDYIVEHTVGKLLDGKTPKQVEKLKILDPACGSGSFLLGAYQRLLDWHRDHYVEKGPDKVAKGRSPKLFQGRGGEWRLTTAEKKRILLNNIYGVDIDPQAVEVTKLSLLLKVLEGENAETLGKTLRMFHERALPDLGDNIKCGNSLIGPDFYDDKQLDLLDEEERYRINAFDWNAEFPDIMNAGGFDAVIGNPPYGGLFLPETLEYFKRNYTHQDGDDLYLLFLEKYPDLLGKNSLLGVIVSNTWLQSVTYRRIRKFLTAQFRWVRVLIPRQVFRAVVDTHVLIFHKTEEDENLARTFSVDREKSTGIVLSHDLLWESIPKNGDPINVTSNPEIQDLFRKIQSLSVPLSEFCEVYNGIKPFEKGKGNPPQTSETMREKPFVKEGPYPGEDWSPLLRGSLIQRYQNRWEHNYWILYGPWLAAPRNHSIFEAPEMLLVRQTGDAIVATLVEHGFYARDNLHVIIAGREGTDLRYVLGIINSRLVDFAYQFMNPERGEALAQVKKRHVELLPMVMPVTAEQSKLQSRMVELVNSMLKIHKDFQAAKTDHAKSLIQRQIDTTDKRIDQLVYALYGLTEKEVKIVEEATGA